MYDSWLNRSNVCRVDNTAQLEEGSAWCEFDDNNNNIMRHWTKQVLYQSFSMHESYRHENLVYQILRRRTQAILLTTGNRRIYNVVFKVRFHTKIIPISVTTGLTRSRLITFVQNTSVSVQTVIIFIQCFIGEGLAARERVFFYFFFNQA